MKNKVLLYVSSSQGELDWIIPVIIELSNMNYNVSIYIDAHSKYYIIKRDKNIILFLKKHNINIYSKSNFSVIIKLLNFFAGDNIDSFFNKILNKLSNIFFTLFKEKFASKIYDFFKPDILLKDLSPDSILRLNLSKLTRLKEGRIVLFPHGTEIFVESKPKNSNYFGDLLLVSSDKMKSHYSKTFKGLPSFIIGIPRYDIKWLDLIKNNTNYPKTKKSKFKILFITRGVHPTDLSNDDFNYLVNSIFYICNKSDDIELLIRNHPRYPKSQLLEILSNYPNLDYRFEDSDLITLKDEINLVVSMWSTMILDALLLNLPVIEFFKCRDKREWPKNDLGELITGYEKNKIVISAKSKDDLSKYINETKEGDYTIYHSIFNSFKKIYNIENSINKTIKAITHN